MLSLFEIVTLVLSTCSKVTNLFKWKQKQRLLESSFPSRVTGFPLLENKWCCAEPASQGQTGGLRSKEDASSWGQTQLSSQEGGAWPADCSEFCSSWVYLDHRVSSGRRARILSRWKTTSPEGDSDAVVLGL